MTAEFRPDVAHAVSKMAVNVARVCRSVDMLSGRIDEMVVAVSREQWREVQEMSRRLAQSSRRLGCRAISALAQRVYDEARKPDNELGIKRSLVRLIGAHGRSGSRRLDTV